MKRIIPRTRASEDIEAVVEHYLVHVGQQVALNFVDEVERTYSRMARYPASGSPRYAFELGIAELRHIRLNGFPYLIFYVELSSHIDVWRVLHAHRDVPSWLEPDVSHFR